MTQAALKDTTLVLSRSFDAPVEKVFAAWTNPEIANKWMAPGEMIAEVDMDARVGGRYRIQMKEPDGNMHITGGEYTEVVENERLTYTWQWEGSDEETLVTVDFHGSESDQTNITVTHSRFSTAALRDDHEQGWTSCIAQLEALLA
jgi:uncharacterized protein YndB with AHSA1/START domain